MSKLTVISLTAAVALATGCNARPSLGTQIDRMGRPAVNTAITNPFDVLAGTTPDDFKDTYNANGDTTSWATEFAGPLAQTLPILDALDGTCGNQLVAKPLVGSEVPVDRYTPLAIALADDQILVNVASGTCTFYLAVEAVGLIPSLAADCGGRTPLYDVIDASYSFLAAGVPAGVSDGIASDGDGAPSLTTFPFLNAPN